MRVAGYARVSTVEQATEGLSLDDSHPLRDLVCQS